MIKKITLVGLFLIAFFANAQIGPVGHLTIFSEDGDRFTLILNGEIINDEPQTNLRVEDLNQPFSFFPNLTCSHHLVYKTRYFVTGFYLVIYQSCVISIPI